MSKVKTPLTRILYEELAPSQPSRSQVRKVEILESAIQLFATRGLEETTFEQIARASKVSRPLVVHYFPDRKELFLSAIKYVRANFQHFAVQAISRHRLPSTQLRAYVESTFDWVREFDTHAKVWGLFYYYCGIGSKEKDIHSDLVRMGHERIMALIDAGAKFEGFQCDDLKTAAKMIQVVITGALVTLLTEKLPFEEAVLRKATIDLCLALAGNSGTSLE